MPDETVLKKIQDFLASLSETEQQSAWNILSAIRGPDSKNDWDGKSYGTIPVRLALCPKMFSGQSLPPEYSQIPKLISGETRDQYYQRIFGGFALRSSKAINNHFVHHIADAFWAIRSCIDSIKEEDNASGRTSQKE